MARRLRRFGRAFWERVTGHELMLRAAAVAFYSVLGLIPLLLLGTAILGYFVGSSDAAVNTVLGIAHRVIPRATGPEVEGFIRRLVESRHIVGVLGIGSLLWIAMGLFDILTFSLTALTGGRDGRSYLHRKLAALVVMGVVGFLFALSVMATWIFAAWEEVEALLGVQLPIPDFFARPDLPRYLTSLFLILLLSLIYWVAPVRTIRWPAILGGAALAGVLWHLVREAFNWYLVHLSRYNLVYGILGGFVGLILWIYYTAIIILLGIVFADLFDGGGQHGAQEAGKT
jgi:membrane protein